MKIVYFSPLHGKGYGRDLFAEGHMGLGAGRWVGDGEREGGRGWGFGYSSFFSTEGGGYGNGKNFSYAVNQLVDTYMNPHYLLTR